LGIKPIWVGFAIGWKGSTGNPFARRVFSPLTTRDDLKSVACNWSKVKLQSDESAKAMEGIPVESKQTKAATCRRVLEPLFRDILAINWETSVAFHCILLRECLICSLKNKVSTAFLFEILRPGRKKVSSWKQSIFQPFIGFPPAIPTCRQYASVI
jgi:hypothetical protein